MPTSDVRSKTRIGSALHNQQLANHLSLHLARLTIENIESDETDLYLYHQETTEPLADPDLVFGHAFRGVFEYQTRLDFMDNVSRSLRLLLDLGYEKAIFLVSDCPYLNREHLETILRLLDSYAVVLHPAEDKGINAIGCMGSFPTHLPTTNVVSRSPGYQLLDEVEVFLASQGVNYFVASPALADIDMTEDVWRFFFHMNNQVSSVSPPRLRELYDFLVQHKQDFGFNPIS
jgi:glycosyltransferase A (GT-A) superfamily protein (DUF2064 family)